VRASVVAPKATPKLHAITHLLIEDRPLRLMLSFAIRFIEPGAG